MTKPIDSVSSPLSHAPEQSDRKLPRTAEAPTLGEIPQGPGKLICSSVPQNIYTTDSLHLTLSSIPEKPPKTAAEPSKVNMEEPNFTHVAGSFPFVPFPQKSCYVSSRNTHGGSEARKRSRRRRLLSFPRRLVVLGSDPASANQDLYPLVNCCQAYISGKDNTLTCPSCGHRKPSYRPDRHSKLPPLHP